MFEAWFLYGGMALCLVSLWAIARKDWVRLRSITRTAEAEVIGHRINRDNDGTSYGAIFRFSAEGAVHEVADEMLHGSPAPPLGTKVKLTYPFGRPDLAHVARPLVWLAVYGVLIVLLGMLMAKSLGWLR